MFIIQTTSGAARVDSSTASDGDLSLFRAARRAAIEAVSEAVNGAASFDNTGDYTSPSVTLATTAGGIGVGVLSYLDHYVGLVTTNKNEIKNVNKTSVDDATPIDESAVSFLSVVFLLFFFLYFTTLASSVLQKWCIDTVVDRLPVVSILGPFRLDS